MHVAIAEFVARATVDVVGREARRGEGRGEARVGNERDVGCLPHERALEPEATAGGEADLGAVPDTRPQREIAGRYVVERLRVEPAAEDVRHHRRDLEG